MQATLLVGNEMKFNISGESVNITFRIWPISSVTSTFLSYLFPYILFISNNSLSQFAGAELLRAMLSLKLQFVLVIETG